MNMQYFPLVHHDGISNYEARLGGNFSTLNWTNGVLSPNWNNGVYSTFPYQFPLRQPTAIRFIAPPIQSHYIPSPNIMLPPVYQFPGVNYASTIPSHDAVVYPSEQNNTVNADCNPMVKSSKKQQCSCKKTRGKSSSRTKRQKQTKHLGEDVDATNTTDPSRKKRTKRNSNKSKTLINETNFGQLQIKSSPTEVTDVTKGGELINGNISKLNQNFSDMQAQGHIQQLHNASESARGGATNIMTDKMLGTIFQDSHSTFQTFKKNDVHKSRPDTKRKSRKVESSAQMKNKYIKNKQFNRKTQSRITQASVEEQKPSSDNTQQQYVSLGENEFQEGDELHCYVDDEAEKEETMLQGKRSRMFVTLFKHKQKTQNVASRSNHSPTENKVRTKPFDMPTRKPRYQETKKIITVSHTKETTLLQDIIKTEPTEDETTEIEKKMVENINTKTMGEDLTWYIPLTNAQSSEPCSWDDPMFLPSLMSPLSQDTLTEEEGEKIEVKNEEMEECSKIHEINNEESIIMNNECQNI